MMQPSGEGLPPGASGACHAGRLQRG